MSYCIKNIKEQYVVPNTITLIKSNALTKKNYPTHIGSLATSAKIYSSLQEAQQDILILEEFYTQDYFVIVPWQKLF